MGFKPDGGVWEIGRGGQLAFAKGTNLPTDADNEEFEQLKVNSRGFGLLDVGKGQKGEGKRWVDALLLG